MGVKGEGVYLKKVDTRSVKQKEGFVLKVSLHRTPTCSTRRRINKISFQWGKSAS